MVLKFHDNPTVNESEIIVFLRQVVWVVGKRKGFGEEKRENENEGKKRHRQSKTDITSLFIPRVHTTYYYSIYLFLIFYKKKLYFIPYRMNKSNFFFLQTIIFHYLFL